MRRWRLAGLAAEPGSTVVRLNPYDPARSRAARPAGAAVALAIPGMVRSEIGSDIGGSIRIPPTCRVFGHSRPYGIVPAKGGTHFGYGTALMVPLAVVGPDGAQNAGRPCCREWM